MKYKKQLLIGLLSLGFVYWFSFRCSHEATTTRIVNHSDLSKDGMVEVVCNKCGKVLHTAMIVITEGELGV